MRGVKFDEFGGPDVLEFADLTEPVARPGDLIIRVRAAGVNRADLNQRQGLYGRENFGDSALLGLELAGEVLSSTSPDFQRGDRVMGIVGGGAYAEIARIPAAMAIRIPDRLDFAQAATIPECFITANEVLMELAGLCAGETVLVHGAAGGVGMAACTLARAAGAKVLFTARSDSFRAVAAIGGEVGFDYRGDFTNEVMAATDGRGVDIIVDPVGSPNFVKNLELLASGGRLMQIGLMRGREPVSLHLDQLMFRRLSVIGHVMKSQSPAEKAAMTRRFVERWLADFADGSLEPLPFTEFPLAEAGLAHAALERGGHAGKMVLIV